MSEVSSFFRHCPSCGRRFHIRLVSKKLVGVRREKVEKMTNIGQSRPSSTGMGTGMFAPVIVQESIPVEVDIEDFGYQYKCGHCGHEWTENRVEEHRE